MHVPQPYQMCMIRTDKEDKTSYKLLTRSKFSKGGNCLRGGNAARIAPVSGAFSSHSRQSRIVYVSRTYLDWPVEGSYRVRIKSVSWVSLWYVMIHFVTWYKSVIRSDTHLWYVSWTFDMIRVWYSMIQCDTYFCDTKWYMSVVSRAPPPGPLVSDQKQSVSDDLFCLYVSKFVPCLIRQWYVSDTCMIQILYRQRR